jgi:hypothetical protein
MELRETVARNDIVDFNEHPDEKQHKGPQSPPPPPLFFDHESVLVFDRQIAVV